MSYVVVLVKSKAKIPKNYVAFSEYMNFKSSSQLGDFVKLLWPSKKNLNFTGT